MKRFDYPQCFNAEEVALTEYNTGRQVTYGELATSISEIHEMLQERAVATGERILIMSNNPLNWASTLAGVVTYGATAVLVDSGFSAEQMNDIKTRSSIRLVLDGCHDLLGDEDVCETARQRDYLDLTDDNILVISYSCGKSGGISETKLSANDFTHMVEQAHQRYCKGSRSRNLSILMASSQCGGATDVLTSLALGGSTTILGHAYNSALLLRCLKKSRPHIINMDATTAESLIRTNILPRLNNAGRYGNINSSLTHRMLLKQIRKEMMYALGGCVQNVVVSGKRISPDIEQFLHKIRFPFTTTVQSSSVAIA